MLELVVSSILFSLSFGLIKSELSTLDPFLVSAIRLGLSLVAFLPFVRRTPVRSALRLASIGFIQLGVMYCFYIMSFRYLLGYQVAILTIPTPLFVVAIDAFFERRWSGRSLASALIAMAASLIAVWDSRGLEASLFAIVLVQISNVCFAAGQLLYRRHRLKQGEGEGDASSFAFVYLGAIVPPLLALLFIGDPSKGPETSRAWLALVYLGLVPAGLGFFLWNKGVAKVSAAAGGVMNTLKAPLAVVIAWLVFGEAIDFVRVIASLALMGVAARIAKSS
jgi:drug/metabolite transporter (DMT)-like permease